MDDDAKIVSKKFSELSEDVQLELLRQFGPEEQERYLNNPDDVITLNYSADGALLTYRSDTTPATDTRRSFSDLSGEIQTAINDKLDDELPADKGMVSLAGLPADANHVAPEEEKTEAKQNIVPPEPLKVEAATTIPYGEVPSLGSRIMQWFKKS